LEVLATVAHTCFKELWRHQETDHQSTHTPLCTVCLVERTSLPKQTVTKEKART